MNSKEITIKTIQSNDYIVGKSIKGKGTEIFEPSTRIFSTKTSMYSKHFDEDYQKVLDLKKREDSSELFLESFYLENIYFKCTFEKQNMSMKNFFKAYKKNPEKFSSVNIYKKPQLLGYISLSKYSSDKDSQIELCQNLIKLDSLEINGESYGDSSYPDYDDSVIEFKSHNNGDVYYKGDYFLEHGSTICESTSECIFFEGRMQNYNETEMHYYSFDEGEYLKEIDPDSTICVYNRKNKDWYVGYSLEQVEMQISFKEENYKYQKNECDEDFVCFNTYKENKDLIEEVLNFLKSEKETLEINCFIRNELDEKFDHGKTNVDFEVVELLFDYESSLRELINDEIVWDYKNIISAFTTAYNNVINSRLRVLPNLKVEATTYSSFSSSNTTTVYKHLYLLSKLQKRYNFELVKSSILENITTKSWAIKQENEEFHFDLARLIANDVTGSTTIRDFLEGALNTLRLRKLQKLDEKELYEKASHVFVSIQDSRKSGNCELGTNSFISAHSIDSSKIGAIRGDVLLEMENSSFTKRAVYYAISNH